MKGVANSVRDVLVLDKVKVDFKLDGTFYNAVDSVDLSVKEGEILAIVGESGCGKSTLATSIMNLHDPVTTRVSGSIKFEGEELCGASPKNLEQIRGAQIGMIFQDPLAALNPLMRIGDQIKESLNLHTTLSSKEKEARVEELLSKVGIDDVKRTVRQYPHELSGGMRQRVMIAIAVACKPKLIIADEPTTALDVTIQAQILDLLKEIQQERGAGIILITHDLGVVAEVADQVAVMYAGQVVERGSVGDIFNDPKHPYTRSLLRSMPQTDTVDDELYVIAGNVPSLKKMAVDGCRFADRIPWVESAKHEAEPKLHEVSSRHFVRCTCYQDFEFPLEGDMK